MNQKKSGFTLIELMVSITIGAIIITSALSVYANFVQTKIQIDIARQMQKEINFALARVTDRVRNCEIERSSSNTFLKLTDCGENITDAKFSLYSEAENSDGSFIMSSENLISPQKFTILGGSEFIITNEIDSDTKELLSQPKVQIFLNVQSKQDPKVTQSVRTTISSRRY